MYCDLWPYVWLINESGFKSRAAYDGARTVYLCIFYFSFHILDADCVLVAVLSHGEMGILYACDQPYKPDRLWSHFNAEKCPTLAGKPKLFFVQVSETEIVHQIVPEIVTEIFPKN